MARSAWKLPRLLRMPRAICIAVVVLLVTVVAIFVAPMLAGREGLEAHKSAEPTVPGAVGLPDTPKNQLPTMKEQKSMFPRVPWGNTTGGQQVNPQAPGSALEQTLGYLQALGSAPSKSMGDGSSVTSSTLIAGVDIPGGVNTPPGAGGAGGGGGAGSAPYGASDPKGAAATASSTHGSSAHHKHQGAQSALPKGIPKSKIPKGQEDLYILKTEVVPPVCPACPACPACPKPVCPKPDPSQCPPCPAPGRCPPPAFGCQRVPLYQNMNSGILPSMI